MKPYVVLILGLLGIGTGILLGVDGGPFDRTPIHQEALHWQFAGYLASDTEAYIAHAPSPLYLKFLASLTHLEPSTARGVLRTVISLLCGMLTFLLFRSAGRARAVAGGLAAAAVPGVVLSAGMFEPHAPAGVLVLAALWVLRGRPAWAAWLIGGLLTGTAALFSPILGWSALLCLIVFALVRVGGTPRAASAALFAAVWLGTAAVGSEVSGSAHLLPQVSGIEVSKGHHRGASGFEPKRTRQDPRRWWEDADYLAAASRDLQRPPTSAGASRYWTQQVVKDALGNLFGETKRFGIKTWGLLQADPWPYPADAAFVARHGNGPGFNILLWLGRIVIPLGIAGWIVSYRRVPPILWAGLAVGFVAFQWSFAQPGLHVVSTALLAGGFGLFAGEVRRKPLTAVLGILCVGVFGLLPRAVNPVFDAEARDRTLLGDVYRIEERGSAAFREYDKALALDPDDPQPRLAIASLLAADEVLDEAIVELTAVHEQHPNLIAPINAAAPLFQTRQRWPELIASYQSLIAINPFNPEYHNNLGTAYASAGFYDRAEAAFKKALQVDPNYFAAQTNLDGMRSAGLAVPENVEEVSLEKAIVLVQEGRLAEAESVLVVVGQQKKATEVQINSLAGTIAMQQGDFAKAQTLFESIRNQAGKSPTFLHNLAVSYASGGKPVEALEIWGGLRKQAPGNEVFRASLAQVRRDLELRASLAKATGDRLEAKRLWEALAKQFPNHQAYSDSLASL